MDNRIAELARRLNKYDNESIPEMEKAYEALLKERDTVVAELRERMQAAEMTEVSIEGLEPIELKDRKSFTVLDAEAMMKWFEEDPELSNYIEKTIHWKRRDRALTELDESGKGLPEWARVDIVTIPRIKGAYKRKYKKG